MHQGWVFEPHYSGQKPSEIVDFRGLFLILDYCGAGGEPAYAFNIILRSNSSAISSRSRSKYDRAMSFISRSAP